jgi:putative NADH-flavin reductase
MKLTVCGASGRIGGEIVRQAHSAGHDVTAVIRVGSTVTNRPDGIRVVEVTTMDAVDGLLPAVAGRDAVLSGLGPRTRRDAGIVAPMTRCLLSAMGRGDVHRVLVVSAAPVGAPHPRNSVAVKAVTWPLITRLLRELYADLEDMEGDLASSGYDWTAVRPPRLVDRTVTGTYRTAVGENLPHGTSISRADVAHAMLTMVEDPTTFRKAVGVAW